MLYWLTSIAALIGVWFNIKKHVSCFYIWTCTNAIWVYADIEHEIYSQATLQAVYFMLAIYGICTWSKFRIKKKNSKVLDKTDESKNTT